MKSVLYVLPSTVIGGAETRFFNIMKHMKGMRCTLLTHLPLAEYFSVLGIKIYSFEEYGCYAPMPSSINKTSVNKTFKYARAIAGVVRHEKIECIIGIMHTGTFYASSAKDIFRLKVAHIGTILGNVSAFFKREERNPTFLERLLLWYLLRRPSLIVVSSKGVRDDLVKNFGIAERRIEVIYNGIDISRVREMSKEKRSNRHGGKIIVTACRLNAQKDFRTLLRAFREVREKIESRLVIVGEGELRDEIIRSAKELDIERNVEITGFQLNPFVFISSGDVFVLSSFFEGFGNAVIEAMALGVPVVATDCPSGPGEIIQNGINGFLVPMQDHHAMAGSILRLLENDDLKREVAARGLERAEHFTVEAMTENFAKLILKCC